MEIDHNPQSDAGIDAQLTNSTQVVGIGLALEATMAFGATFSLPGGYRSDDHEHGGTPTLAGLNFFSGLHDVEVVSISVLIVGSCKHFVLWIDRT